MHVKHLELELDLRVCTVSALRTCRKQRKIVTRHRSAGSHRRACAVRVLCVCCACAVRVLCVRAHLLRAGRSPVARDGGDELRHREGAVHARAGLPRGDILRLAAVALGPNPTELDLGNIN